MYIYIYVLETWYVTSYALFINHTGVSINGGYRKNCLVYLRENPKLKWMI